MKKSIILVIGLFLFCPTKAQYLQLQPLSCSPADASVADTGNYTAFQNPALISYESTPVLGIYYQNSYFISALSTKSVQISYPNPIFNAALNFAYSGIPEFHETLTGINFARNFGDFLSVGLGMNLYSFYDAEENHQMIYPQIGVIYQPDRRYLIGFHTVNPFLKGQMNGGLRIPSLFSVGTSIYISKELKLLFQFDRQISEGNRICGGAEYEFVKKVAFQFGVIGGQFAVSNFGFVLHQQPWKVNLQCEIHPLLGIDLHTGISFQFTAFNKNV